MPNLSFVLLVNEESLRKEIVGKRIVWPTTIDEYQSEPEESTAAEEQMERDTNNPNIVEIRKVNVSPYLKMQLHAVNFLFF